MQSSSLTKKARAGIRAWPIAVSSVRQCISFHSEVGGRALMSRHTKRNPSKLISSSVIVIASWRQDAKNFQASLSVTSILGYMRPACAAYPALMNRLVNGISSAPRQNSRPTTILSVLEKANPLGFILVVVVEFLSYLMS